MQRFSIPYDGPSPLTKTKSTSAQSQFVSPAENIHIQDAEGGEYVSLFVRDTLNEAIARGASDVHFEPRSDRFIIRFRIDGALVEYASLQVEQYQKTLNTIKVLADVDISEHAVPQDGHIELSVQENTPLEPLAQHERSRVYDIRVSTFPSVNGEVVVMRILNRSGALLSLEELGMDKESLATMREILELSYGMMLITGPTGSGKTTTLYALLRELKSEDRNIITLEDPIEFHLDWLRQCEIHEQRGFTFERAMASVLRQDPDVLMLGEIRSAETAEQAMRSALVGRIVGSTIHANTAVGTIARLIDLGISRSVLAHALHGIIAQRLVRKICEHCKVPDTPTPAQLAHFGLSPEHGPFFRGAGCDMCGGTGYKGRVGIFSVMSINPALQALIFEQKPLAEIQDTAIRLGMKTLKADAGQKILAGSISVEETLKVL
jgi:general secretion pathway protein E